MHPTFKKFDKSSQSDTAWWQKFMPGGSPDRDAPSYLTCSTLKIRNIPAKTNEGHRRITI